MAASVPNPKDVVRVLFVLPVLIFFYKSKSNLFFKMVLICVHVIEDRTLEAKKMERIETHSQESAGMNVSVESCFRDFYNVL
jgi:hypothetical protein